MIDVSNLEKDLAAAEARFESIHAEIDAFIEGGHAKGAASQTAAMLALSTSNRGKQIIASAADDLKGIDDPALRLGFVVVGMSAEVGFGAMLISIREEIDQCNQHVTQAQERLEDAKAKAQAAETK